MIRCNDPCAWRIALFLETVCLSLDFMLKSVDFSGLSRNLVDQGSSLSKRFLSFINSLLSCCFGIVDVATLLLGAPLIFSCQTDGGRMNLELMMLSCLNYLDDRNASLLYLFPCLPSLLLIATG